MVEIEWVLLGYVSSANIDNGLNVQDQHAESIGGACNSRRKRGSFGARHILKLALIFIFLNVSIVSAEELNVADCQMIQGYEKASGKSYVDHFVEYANQAVDCVKSTAFTSCQPTIRKRQDDFFAAYVDTDIIEDTERKASFRQAEIAVLMQVKKTTGLTSYFERQKINRGALFYYFVNKPDVEARGEEFLLSFVAPPEWGETAARREKFSYFINDDTVPCATLTSDFVDGVVRISTIWIKSDISKETLERCVAEETINSLGLNAGESPKSIFDNSYMRENSGNGLSPFDLLDLKFLYLDAFLPGLAADDVRRIATETISAQCDAN